MSIENTDTFGNYLIHGIDEIIVPEAISWWPSAPGWQMLGILVLLWLLVLVVRLIKYEWRNRYRRQVLKQLDQLQQNADNSFYPVVKQLPYYLKVTALQAYPRHEIASLSGNEWLNFLDAHYSGPAFSKGVAGNDSATNDMGQKLLMIAYLPQAQWQLSDNECKTLIQMSRRWIKKHKEATHV